MKTKWILECHKLYKEFVGHVSEKPTDPSRLEEALAGAKAKRQVGPGELEIIENSDYWPYPKWWPQLSKQFGKPITLPPSLYSRAEKKKAVGELQERLKHIEVVSIILRFIFPEEFGIISPPVTGLLNLVSGKNHEQQYLRYLSVLGELRQRYGVLRGLPILTWRFGPPHTSIIGRNIRRFSTKCIRTRTFRRFA